MAGHGADHAVAVDEAVVDRIIAAVVPENADMVAVGRYGQGQLPLVRGGIVIIDANGLTPGVAAVSGHCEENVRLVGGTVGLVIVDHINVAGHGVDSRLRVGVAAEGTAVGGAVGQSQVTTDGDAVS